MQEILDILLDRLGRAGLLPVECLRLAEDVFQMFRDGGEFTVQTVNNRLSALGWPDEVLDEFTFELFVGLLENHEDLQVECHSIH